MSISENLKNLTGKWGGINRLYVPWMPENPVRESDSNANISLVAKTGFLKIQYDWSFDEKAEDGLLLLGGDQNSQTVKAVWIDSWHSGNDFLISEGNDKNDGAISVKGFYKVSDHPDWGWRTIVETENNGRLKITMYNVSPANEEDLAVEMMLNRI